MEYSLKRMERKSIGIYIQKDGSIQVRCPAGMDKKLIDEFVLSKRKWIEENSAAVAKRNEEKNIFTVQIGSYIRYLGKEYIVESRDEKKVGFDYNCFFVPNEISGDDLKFNLIKLYKLLASNIIKIKVEKFSNAMNVNPMNVKINSAKTRWGSCSGQNNLNFSWLLIMADEDCIDYVVVHELSHITEHNHSKRFWSIVAAVLPDYKERQKKLGELSKKLTVEDWN